MYLVSFALGGLRAEARKSVREDRVDFRHEVGSCAAVTHEDNWETVLPELVVPAIVLLETILLQAVVFGANLSNSGSSACRPVSMQL